jgi:arylsulfatase A-like enzyme
VRERNAFLPPGRSDAEARAIPDDRESYFCRAAARDPDPAAALALLRGLYLGDVHAADAKLGRIRTMLDEAGLSRDLITIATADHGEAFGEHEQVGHLVGVSEALARVPLVVHGVPDAAPVRIDVPVQLADVYASVLAWAGLGEPTTDRRPLPTRDAPSAPVRDVVVEWTDPAQVAETGPSEQLSRALRDGRERLAKLREACTAGQDLFGSRTAFIRSPWKLVLGPDDRARLYDVVQDPDEARDVAAAHPDVVRSLRAALAAHQATQPKPPRMKSAVPEPPAEVQERLRALGYLDAD